MSKKSLSDDESEEPEKTSLSSRLKKKTLESEKSSTASIHAKRKDCKIADSLQGGKCSADTTADLAA